MKFSSFLLGFFGLFIIFSGFGVMIYLFTTIGYVDDVFYAPSPYEYVVVTAVMIFGAWLTWKGFFKNK